MSTTSLTLTGTIATPNGGYLTVGTQVITNANSVGAESNPTLTTSPTTITKPTNAKFVLIQPPVGNTVGITVETNSNSAGIHIDPAIGALIGLYSDVTQIVLTADAAMTTPTQVIWG